MALPTAEKTWQYDVNNTVIETTAAAMAGTALWTIKNAMVSFNSSPWTVVGSSNDSGSFGLDGVDRWTSGSDLRWATSGNISWIVLEQSGIDGYFQLLISTNVANTHLINMSFSKGGLFTGGSATAPPTATDAVTLRNGTAWGPATSSSNSFVIHVMQSTDGECTRVLFHRNETSTYNINVFSGFWLFDKIKQPTEGWVFPYICGVVADNDFSTSGDIGVISAFNSGFLGTHESTSMVVSLVCEHTYASSSLSVLMYSQSKITNRYLFLPIGIVSFTANVRGRHGKLYDIWWGNTYITDGSKYGDGEFVKVGCFVLPWPTNVEYVRA
jgi:hypothetical protein